MQSYDLHALIVSVPVFVTVESSEAAGHFLGKMPMHAHEQGTGGVWSSAWRSQLCKQG